MLRTIVLVLVLAVACMLATAGVYVTRLRHEVTKSFAGGYTPRPQVYSPAFTEALWAQVERQTPVELDRNVTVLSLVLAAATGKAQESKGFLLASVAARSLALAEHAPEDMEGGRAVMVLRELLRAEALLKKLDVDTLAAIYAESAPFGGNLTGLDQAAWQFFGKPPALLDPVEAATLLTISWTPNRCDLERLRERRNALLAKMQSMQLAPASSPPTLGVAVLPLAAACQR